MTATLTRLLHHLRRRVLPPELASDAELLDRFGREHDEDAFAALVVRHGPLVFNVCRRVLGDAHDAEDAFQATFLVLARKAGAVGRPAALAGWLHGVAYRVALKVREAGASSRLRQPPPDIPEPSDPRPDPLAELTARELLAILEAEVQRLPEVYRLPVALCCLEGFSQEEAARRLGWTPGSVKGRLERGRKRLHARLARRGLTLTAALSAVEVARGMAGMSSALAGPTIDAACLFAANQAAGNASVRPVVLAEGVLRMMAAKRLRSVVALGLVGVALLAAGVVSRAPLSARAAEEGTDSSARADVTKKPLWAALSVNRPVFREGDTGTLQINFALVNEGDRVIDPKLPSSRIVVNGKPLPDSGRIFGNGPRDARFEALPPGDSLQFSYALGKHFEKPAVYRVHWEGEGFRSAEIVFRVLPKRAKSAPPEVGRGRGRPGPPRWGGRGGSGWGQGALMPARRERGGR
ncbi:MAG TPA: sigma-70 family RNA polymerase sigma factor [Gemmataceae bacterium]|nr:sigma-70 family RNA polymerase sigma factor [Gemmataceae bacterium]